jgi:putative spermidine/putrescine transport system ATP-binding protein
VNAPINVRAGDAVRSLTGATVEFDAVCKSYGHAAALQPTNLTVHNGEFFGIIGPSGSGKSTLLGIVAGFVAPSGGAVRVDGIDVVSLPPYRRHFGMVFQGYALFPHMTAGENIAFPLRMRRYSRTEITARVRRALEMVRLEGFADRHPAQLSGGQQQRVALARAAVYEPKLLLMDEPLGALDKNLREEMQEEIKHLQATLGATVIYVTHDQHEAASMSDRLAVMRDGRLEQIGEPRQIYEQPRNEFIATFLGEASILPVDVALAGEAGIVLAQTAGGLQVRVAAATVPCGKVGVCLRPENITLGAAASQLDNVFSGEIVESVFTTGTVRYRARLTDAQIVVTVRVPSHPGIALLPSGSRVQIGWSSLSTALVAIG